MDNKGLERLLGKEQFKKLINLVQFNLIIGSMLLWGSGIFILMVNLADSKYLELIKEINNLWFIIIGLALFGLGIYLFRNSDNPLVSFIGYNFIVIPFGLVAFGISTVNSALIINAIRATGIVILLVVAAGVFHPSFFERTIIVLSIAVGGFVVIELFEVFVFGIPHDIIDWISGLFLCANIGYKWGRAHRIPPTIDNAIDTAAGVYIDIFNNLSKIKGRWSFLRF